MNRLPASIAALAVVGLSATPAFAQVHELSIGVAGEKFKLDPTFTIAIDGTVIGEGTVDNAIDTTAGATMRAAEDPASLVDLVTFPIPQSLLVDGAVLTVTFSGGSYDAATGADTNLYIASIEIDGRPLALEEAQLNDGANPDGAIMLVGGMLGLYANGATASFTLDAVPATDMAQTEPPAAEPQAEPEAAEPAAASPVEPPAAAPVCTTATTLEVSGFGNNGLSLADAARGDIDALEASLSGQDCVITVTGYASTSGSDSANQRISLARAELVRDQLIEAGIAAEAITTTGAGETDQFGDSQQDNRRVVITVAATR